MIVSTSIRGKTRSRRLFSCKTEVVRKTWRKNVQPPVCREFLGFAQISFVSCTKWVDDLTETLVRFGIQTS